MGENSEPTTGVAEGNQLAWFELALVFIVTLLGFACRAALPARMAVEHFDEGVYASNFFFSGDKRDERYPDQHLYAPPLVPLLIELAMVVFGRSNLAALGVGVVAGGLTVPLVWWTGRRWFGPTSGLVAATLLALSDVHILFSRTALTDVVLCFFLVAAVHCFWVSQTTPNRLALFASGILTGLAWWTKYNGWLPLAIGLAGVFAWRIAGLWNNVRTERGPRLSGAWQVKPLARSLAIWVGVAIIALAVWGPWLWSLQAKGGYAAVAVNHRGYLVGVEGWRGSFATQARNLALLSGPLTGCSSVVALVLALLRMRGADSRFTWNGLVRNDAIFFAVPVLCLLCVIEGSGVILAFLGIVGVAIGLGQALQSERAAAGPTRGGLAAWLLTAWLAGLVVSVPLYTPYPRLVLPLLMAGYLGVGVLADFIVGEIQRAAAKAGSNVGIEPLLSLGKLGSQALARARPIYLLAIGVAIAAAVWQRSPWEHGIIGWQPRAGLKQLALEIRDDAARIAGANPQSELDRFVIYTYGEPALLFQLRLSGCVFVRPVKDLEFANPDARPPRLPSFVAFGPQALRTPGFGEQLAEALPRLQPVGKYHYTPSDVVLLDSRVEHIRRPEYEIEVYLVK